MLLHALIPASRANGPGIRAVVFFQGCSLGCPKCWNPKTHHFHGAEVTVDAVVQEVLRAQAQDALVLLRYVVIDLPLERCYAPVHDHERN
jgi:anaerobic ribonucleoside-triphosphate reductase activating protein